MQQRVYIQEVVTRDGFQSEPIFIPTAEKIALIDRLSTTGVSKIEVTSFTSPKAIPALSDAEAVMQGIQRNPEVTYAVLVPNLRGCERALNCQADELNLVMSASDSHGLANLRMTPQQSLQQFAQIQQACAGHPVQLNVSISATFGCPFEGHIAPERIFALIESLVASGISYISLCDTTGMANPAQVQQICRAALTRWPTVIFTLHLHNTRGFGLANALAGWQAGIRYFDSSLGGLGGCPYAPGATGNICTEDLVHMLQNMGVDTGVDLGALVSCAEDLPRLVEHPVPGYLLKAGRTDRRYPLPESVNAQLENA